MKDQEKHFGLLRSIFWPVHRSEVKKVVSMLVLLFLLCVCYSVLRNLKDTLILTAKHSGAEVIPFIKVWGILPASFLGAWIFTRLRRYFSKEKVFYILISSFIIYFLFFAFVLYPSPSIAALPLSLDSALKGRKANSFEASNTEYLLALLKQFWIDPK